LTQSSIIGDDNAQHNADVLSRVVPTKGLQLSPYRPAATKLLSDTLNVLIPFGGIVVANRSDSLLGDELPESPYKPVGRLLANRRLF